MGFTKKTWKDRVSEYPNRRRLVKTDGETEIVTVEREEGSVSVEGDAFDAETMNDLEDRIEAECITQDMFTVSGDELILEWL